MRKRSVFACVLACSGLLILAACGTTDTAADTAPGDDVADASDAGPDVCTTCDAADDADICKPACDGKTCGDDGCGGSCGVCENSCSGAADDPALCVEGNCQVACCPACDGKVCGDDGCGGSCGPCQYGECSADQTECVCDAVANCAGKVCGDDGCGGTCAPGCSGSEICSADQASCPGVFFGKASHFNALYIPGTPEETYTGADFANIGGSVCLDINDDGTVDNGLGALLETLAGFGVDANGEVKKMFDEGSLFILLDLGDDPEAGPFDLNGYMGQPGAAAGEYLVDPTSFVDGEAMIHFAGAEINAGKMELGPITFPLGSLLAGLLASAGIPPLDITLDKVQLVGTVDGAIDADGVAFKDGTLAGAIFKADLDKALYLARKWCAEDPEAPADVCGYIQMADMSLIETFLTWDQEIENCGKKIQVYDANDPMIVIGEEDNCQAVSACLFWGSDKAKITGIAPASAE